MRKKKMLSFCRSHSGKKAASSDGSNYANDPFRPGASWPSSGWVLGCDSLSISSLPCRRTTAGHPAHGQVSASLHVLEG